MIIGDRLRRHFAPSSLEQAGIEFVCLLINGEKGPLRIRIRIPSCWDGVRVDSPDYKSHVAYPSGVTTKPCPPTYPVRIPSLLYETTWNIKAFDHLRRPSDKPFVLSQGDPTWYGCHADFLNGWEVDPLETALRDPTCGNTSGGRIDFCQALRSFLQTNQVQNLCLGTVIRVVEPVAGVLEALSGCNPVQGGPEDAVLMTCGR